MATLWIDGLCKKYPAFYLDHVTFEVGEGKIMGFVGRNGAGKTTTIKSLFNYVHPDEGEIYFFGLNFKSNELEIKSRVGYVGSDGGFYAQKRLGKAGSLPIALGQIADETVAHLGKRELSEDFFNLRSASCGRNLLHYLKGRTAGALTICIGLRNINY